MAGYLAGARPGPAPATQAEALWGADGWFRLGLVAYLAGFALLGWAWWRLGQVLRSAEAPPGYRWLLITGTWWAAPLLLAPPLGSRDLYAYACQGAGWLSGHDPYAVGAAGADCPWLASVPGLWQETTAPYGPFALLLSAAAVAVATAMAGDADAQLLIALGGLRMAAVAGAVLVAAALPRLARACQVPPSAALWLGLVTPLVAVHAVSGGHNDALVAGLIVVALAAVVGDRSPTGPAGSPEAGGRDRSGDRWRDRLRGASPEAAGMAVALAVAVKVTAVAVLPFVLLLAAGRAGTAGPGRGWWAAARVGLAAAVGFGTLSVATGLGAGWSAALADTGALAQWSSLPTALGMATGYLLWGLGAPEAYDPAVAVARALGLVALALTAVVWWVQSWRRAADPAAVVVRAGAVLAAVVVLGPVVYPWYAVAALAVLAASLRSARARRWLAVATLVLTALTLPSGLGVPVLTKFPGAVLVAVATLAAAGWWWHRTIRPASRQAPQRAPRRAQPD